jgi:hypothetical protein
MFCLTKPTTLLLFIHIAFSAITKPLTSDGDAVEQNVQGTWCYYPKPDSNPQTICRGANADIQAVVDAHLNQTISISYYNAALTRMGGAEWPFPASTQEKFYLCLSGRAGDGSYETSCERSVADNRIHDLVRCVVALGQMEVSDGCYVPGQASTAPPASRSAFPSGSTQASGQFYARDHLDIH